MKKVESYYDQRASTYDAVFNSLYFKIYDEATWKHLEPVVPEGIDARVLDAAGGTGRWSIKLAEKGCRVTLLDISEGMLGVARERIGERGLQHLITVEKGDVRDLGYEDEAFDMILCEHALFLLEEPEAAIGEFARVLKKDAPLVISAHNRYVHSLARLPSAEAPTVEKLEEALSVLKQIKHDSMTRDGEVRIHTYTPDEFRELLERNGFRIEKSWVKGSRCPLESPADSSTGRITLTLSSRSCSSSSFTCRTGPTHQRARLICGNLNLSDIKEDDSGMRRLYQYRVDETMALQWSAEPTASKTITAA